MKKRVRKTFREKKKMIVSLLSQRIIKVLKQRNVRSLIKVWSNNRLRSHNQSYPFHL
jgi:hypothetical protein